MESDTDKYCLCLYDDTYREYLFYCKINEHYCGFKSMESIIENNIKDNIKDNIKVVYGSKIEIEQYFEKFREKYSEKFCKNFQIVEYSKFLNEYNMYEVLS